jgi:hypothetical protein
MIANTDREDPVISVSRFLLPPRPVLILLGLLLLVACAGKGYTLLSNPILLNLHFWTSRWFQTFLVEGELFFGLWLLTGLHLRGTWLLAVACFFAFFQFNFYLFLAGETSCPCFGSTRIHPGQTALLDLVAVLALLACKPFPDGTGLTVSSRPERFREFLVIFGLLGIPAIVLLGGRPDPSLLPALRNDPLLAERMTVQVNHPSNGELLAILQKNTRLVITADSALTEQRPSFGSALFHNIAAWTLMEQMVGEQAMRTSWVKTAKGYHLVPASLLYRLLHWVLAAVLFALISATLLWFRPREHHLGVAHHLQLNVVSQRHAPNLNSGQAPG